MSLARLPLRSLPLRSPEGNAGLRSGARVKPGDTLPTTISQVYFLRLVSGKWYTHTAHIGPLYTNARWRSPYSSVVPK